MVAGACHMRRLSYGLLFSLDAYHSLHNVSTLHASLWDHTYYKSFTAALCSHRGREQFHFFKKIYSDEHKIFVGRSHELLKNVSRTRGVYLTGSASNRSAYHTQILCPPAADDDDESKLKLIFCTVKCFCTGIHGNATCYCCQKAPEPVCYDQLSDCKAKCPTICNPLCPPVLMAAERLHATKNNVTSYL